MCFIDTGLFASGQFAHGFKVRFDFFNKKNRGRIVRSRIVLSPCFMFSNFQTFINIKIFSKYIYIYTLWNLLGFLLNEPESDYIFHSSIDSEPNGIPSGLKSIEKWYIQSDSGLIWLDFGNISLRSSSMTLGKNWWEFATSFDDVIMRNIGKKLQRDTCASRHHGGLVEGAPENLLKYHGYYGVKRHKEALNMTPLCRDVFTSRTDDLIFFPV